MDSVTGDGLGDWRWTGFLRSRAVPSGMALDELATNWLLALIAALLAVLVLDATGQSFVEPLAPIANVLALVTFLAFVLATGAFLVYTASFKNE
ncbi:putative membrane protein [Halalkaliarchaeum sp. AArc-CO]|nr:putative membrane protein [Halalkaliarchaeum sp. AArc-CO]